MYIITKYHFLFLIGSCILFLFAINFLYVTNIHNIVDTDVEITPKNSSSYYDSDTSAHNSSASRTSASSIDDARTISTGSSSNGSDTDIIKNNNDEEKWTNSSQSTSNSLVVGSTTTSFSRTTATSTNINIHHNTFQPWKNFKEQQLYQKPQLPLLPPYRIWIFAQPRTGSTFIMHLLDAIVNIKSPPGTNVILKGIIRESEKNWYQPQSFVYRTHEPPPHYDVLPDGQRLFESGQVAIFTSVKNDGRGEGVWSKMVRHSLYTQYLSNVSSCSTCEVDNYKHIFNMTEEEVQRVKEYIKTYEIIRRCCGLQMSKWERKRLHGCTITEEEKQRPEYPHCEVHNKQDVEKKFVDGVSGIQHRAFNEKLNWRGLGDCEKFDDMIISGKDFNGKLFKGCDSINL